MSFLHRFPPPLTLALVIAIALGIAVLLLPDSPRPEIEPSREIATAESGPRPFTISPQAANANRVDPVGTAVENSPRESTAADNPFVAFEEWAKAWNGSTNEIVIAEGVRLAQARKTALYDLIAEAPESALARSLGNTERDRFPQAIRAWLETPIDGRGDYEYLAAAPHPGGPLPPRSLFRTATVDGTAYDAYVPESMEGDPTRLDVPLSGVAVDDRIALRKNPTRRPEIGEALPESDPIPVALAEHIEEPPSGSAAAPLLIRGDLLIRPCCESHAGLMTDRPAGEWPAAAWGDKGEDTPEFFASASEDVAASSWTEGTKQVLAILVDFPDLTGTPETNGGTTLDAAYITDRINNEVHYFYDEASYGKTGLTMSASDVTPVLRMPQNAQTYAEAGDNGVLRTDATTLAENAGFNFDDYDRIFLVFSAIGTSRYPASLINYGGLGQISNKFMWMNGGFGLGLVAHELGHTYGLPHASRWEPTNSNPVDPAGSEIEYGDVFDRMGSGSSSHPLHPGTFNPWFLNRMDWLPSSGISEVSESGSFRVYRFDHKSADLAQTRALKISRDPDRDYWIGYRRKYAGDPSKGDIADGAYIHWGSPTGFGKSHLIDIDTPGSNPNDASLNVGNSFDDTAAGIDISVDAAGGSGAGEYIDITITFDPRITISDPVIDVDEQLGVATLWLERSGEDSGVVTVNYQTVGDTATSGVDFTATSGSVVWGDNDTLPNSIEIPITADAIEEGSETFTVELTSITGGVIVGESIATINIVEPGTADGSFSHPWFTNSGSIQQFALEPGGKIAFAGRTGGFGGSNVGGVGRMEPDGSRDDDFSSFGAGGDVIPIRSIVRQPDGKYVVAGNFSTIHGESITRVARLNEDGSVDPTFNPGTGPNAEVMRVALQPNGKIVIVGSFTSVDGVSREGVARLNSDGSLDTSFFTSSPAGANTITPETVALQPDGKVLIGGFLYADWNQVFDDYSSGIWRLNTDGSIDTSFDIGEGAHAGATNQLRNIYDIDVLPDGKVLAGGNFTGFAGQSQPYLVRLNSDGSVDSGFRTALGTGPDNNIRRVLPLNDGSAIVGGRFKNFDGNSILYAARLTPAGALDPDFDANLYEVVPNGTFENSVQALALQPDGKILIGQDIYGNGQQVAARVFAGLPGLPGIVNFTATTFSGLEGETLEVYVRRQSGSYGPVSVSYATIGGSAAEGTDYTAASGVLSWADGEIGARIISIPLTGDGVVEGAETFTVQLGIPIGGVSLGTRALTQVTINEADGTAIDPLTKTVDHQGQTYQIAVTSSESWTASESLAWADISPTSGTGSGMITVTVDPNVVTSSRAGDITIQGLTHSLTQQGAPPATSIDPTTANPGSAAGSYTIDVTSNTNWSVSESLPWVSVSPASGSGNDTITVTYLENPLAAQRGGSIFIGGETHTITQAAAPAFTQISPASTTVDHQAQTYDITITSTESWSVSESLGWASVSPAGGTGNGTVTVTVVANPNTVSRNGTITIGGESHSLTQQAAPPTVSINPITRIITSGARTYDIDITANTSWSVTESIPWLSVSPASGSGNATLTVTVQENPTTNQRSDTFTVGTANHTTIQQGAPPIMEIDPTSKTVDAAAQSYQVAITSNTDWTVTESLDWASVSPTSGSGDGTVTVTVTEHTTVGSSRNGNIDIGGETHALTQDGVPAVTEISPSSKNVDETGQTYDITVTSNTDWTVSESLNWVSVSPASGNGNDTVTVTVSANASTSSRNGPIIIGGESHDLTQDGAPAQTAIDIASNTVDPSAQTYPIQVTSNTNWTATEALDWVTLSPSSGTGDDTVTVSISENTSTNSRNGSLTIGGQSHDLTQQGVPAVFTLDPSENEVAPAATSYSIELTSNTGWTVVEALPWASVSPSSGFGNATLTVTVEANPTTVPRMGDIDVGSAAHELTQLGQTPFLDVSPATRGINETAQVYTFEISSNAPWSITETADWISVNPESGSGDEIITVAVLENTDPESRSGILQIGADTHTVTQSGLLESVILTPDTEGDLPDTAPVLWTDELAGIYDGILRDAADGHTLVGAIHRMSVTPARANGPGGGNVTATLYLNGRRAVIRGAFDDTGLLDLDLNQRDGTVISVELQLEDTGTANEERVVGTIAWDGLVAEADLPRAPFHPRLNPVPTPAEDAVNGVDTFHTMLLPRDPGWTAQQPGGDGWATVNINRGGVVRVLGALGDGTRFAEVGYLSAAGSFDLFSEIYRPVAGLGRGRIGGRLILRDQIGVSDFDGLMQWLKQPDPRERRYADGFSVETWGLGSVFASPAPGSPVLETLALQEFNAALGLRGTELPDAGAPIDKVVTWRPNDTFAYYGPERFSGRVNRRTGQMKGSYFDPTSRTRLALRGVAFQKQQRAAGQFLLPTTSGAFGIQPGTEFPYPGSEDAGMLTRLEDPDAPAIPPATNAVGTFETAAAGIFAGTVEGDVSGDHEGGLLNFRVSLSGAFSGQLWVGRDKFNVRGSFDPATGTAQVPVPIGGGLTALLDLTLEQVDGADPETGYRLSASIQIEGIDYEIVAERRPGTTTKDGAYTVVILAPDVVDPELAPGGDGYGVLTVTPTGICRGFVVLADGFRTALTGHLSTTHELSLFRPLYAGRRGFLAGRLTFREQAGISDLDGEVHWVRQADAPPATVYPGGFDTVRGVVGSTYTRPGPGERAIEGLADDFFNAWLRLSGPDFSGDAGLGLTEIDRAITWQANNRLIYYGPERILLRFNARNGLLTGRYIDRNNSVNASLGGVLLQEQDLVSGSAIAGGVSGLLGIEGR